MFEGRNVEHLSSEEVGQLDDFVQDLEYCLSLYLYGHGNDAIQQLMQQVISAKTQRTCMRMYTSL